MDRLLPEDVQVAVGTTVLRVVGAQRLLGRDVAAAVLSLMGEPADLATVLDRTRDLPSWVAAWRDVAGVHVAAADESQPGSGERLRRLRLATLGLSFANQAHTIPDLYRQVSADLVDIHARLHRLVRAPYEPVQVQAGHRGVPGLLRVPDGADAPAPVTVVLQGLERSKEQTFPLEDALLARGIATLSVDQPGVGAALAAGVTLGDAAVVDDFASGVVRAVTTDARLDPKRVFLFGFSLGGAMALAIAHATGAAGVVTLGAPAHIDPADLSVTARRRARFAAGVRTDAEVVELLESVDLKHRIAAIDVPVLVLQGGSDPVVHHRQAAAITEAARRDVEVRIYPGGDHSCTQYASAVWALTADRIGALAAAAPSGA